MRDGGEVESYAEHERCLLCGRSVRKGRMSKHLFKAHAGDGVSRRPGLREPEETGQGSPGKMLLRCSACGTVVREDRYAGHVRKAHPPQTFAPSSAAPKGPKYSEFAGMSDEDLERRVREIARELNHVPTNIGTGPEEDLRKERRRITAELRSRKGFGQGAPPGRWYKGPGKVRYWKPGGEN